MKKKLSTFILLTFVLMCVTLAFTSCVIGETQSSPTKLNAPTVVLSGDTATWAQDTNADKFEISIDGSLSYIENSVTSKRLTDGQIFKIRAVGDGSNYSTSDWSNSVTYTSPTPPPADERYTITWKNGDLIIETDTQVAKGTMPTYDGETPVKASDAQYSYAFAGWSPEITEVTGNVTYSAVFNSTLRKYTVTWKNGDEILETDTEVEYGAMPSYDGTVPTKTATAQYTYTFKGWTPVVSSVTGDVTYTAEFSQAVNRYTVTFYNEGGTSILDSVTVNYGEAAVYSKAAPTKNATESHTFIFDKWVTEQGGSIAADLESITEDITVFASFKSFVRNVSVYIVSNNIDYGTVSLSVIDNVPYGSAISVNDNTVTINGQASTASASAKTAQYTYSFNGWTADATVGNDTVITANFSRSINKYTVTWKNGDEILETDKDVSYGTMPIYNGAVPTKPSDNENTYKFSGWSPSISSVVGDVTYVAEFASAANTHTVIFYDEDGTTELGRAVVGHGGNAVYPNELPTKEQSAAESFAFAKWVTAAGGNTEAVLTEISSDTAVYASYTASPRMYTVTFVDWDGTVLKEETVAYGESATEPEEQPEKDNARFDKWSSSFNNITNDLTVTPVFVSQYQITFLDHDNTVIRICNVDVANKLPAEMIPDDPIRPGYIFSEWSISNIENITVMEDLEIIAVYEKLYTVTFLNYDGTVLKSQPLCIGESATPPSNPNRYGYTFVGWDSEEYNNISADLEVWAVYEINRYTVKFTTQSGEIIGEIINDVSHGSAVQTPSLNNIPRYILDWDNVSAYEFSSWTASNGSTVNNVIDDTVFVATYETEVSSPVLVINNIEIPRNSSGVTNVTVTAMLVASQNQKIYGLDFAVQYDKDLRIATDTSENKNPLVIFNLLDNTDSDYDKLYNIDSQNYKISYSSISQNGYLVKENLPHTPIEITFKVNSVIKNSYDVSILEGACIVDENFNKIDLIIINGSITVK